MSDSEGWVQVYDEPRLGAHIDFEIIEKNKIAELPKLEGIMKFQKCAS